MLKLNDTAAFIAETLQEERSFDEVVAKLREEYEIDEETAVKSVESVVEKLRQVGFIEE